MPQGTEPKVFDEILARSKDVVRLFEEFPVVNTTEQHSQPIWVAAFRRFLLFLKIDSTGAPTTVQIKVQFLDQTTGHWHDYKQGLFASLIYEDTDTADGVYECFSGIPIGRQMRVALLGVGCTTLAYFKVTASVELMF